MAKIEVLSVIVVLLFCTWLIIDSMPDNKSVTVTVKVPTVEKEEIEKEPKHWITEWFYNSWCTYEAEGRNKMYWMRCNA